MIGKIKFYFLLTLTFTGITLSSCGNLIEVIVDKPEATVSKRYIGIINKDGTNRRQLTTNGHSSPYWSFDGKKIAIVKEEA
jgi:hypothetical protein